MARGPQGALRRGWTTGACAAAAARAAYAALLDGAFPEPVTITLAGGERPTFALACKEQHGSRARAGIVKDAGDDPDVTHGALIIADVVLLPAGSGVRFAAGEGVGTVTLPGLPLGVAEPAINPGPRAMIRAALDETAQSTGLAAANAAVTVSIPGDAALAAKTLNARLGILGGLSILGTTGIVIRYSCAAWIHAVHRGIDVARAAGVSHIAASTGSVSETAVRNLFDLPEVTLIDMGDFVGGTLKYLRRHPVRRLTLAGGFGKLAKLAAGHLDLHSGRSRVDVGALADLLGSGRAPAPVIEAARTAESGGALLAQLAVTAPDQVAPLADAVARRAREVALATLPGGRRIRRRRGVAAFAPCRHLYFLVRLVDPPGTALPLAAYDLLVARGPFPLAAERRLLADHGIDVLVCKASGGAATAAKLVAAREAGLQVVMVDRPAPEAGDCVASVPAALEWLAARLG